MHQVNDAIFCLDKYKVRVLALQTLQTFDDGFRAKAQWKHVLDHGLKWFNHFDGL
jgi:hypothetical protein